MTTEGRSPLAAARRLLAAPDGALWIGFAGLLLLMAGMAADAMVSLRGVVAATINLGVEARQRDNLLDQLRADIDRSSTLVRDHLSEIEPARASVQRAELELLRARTTDTLRAYAGTSPRAERDAFRSLNGRIASYWQSLAPALAWDDAARRARGHSFLQDVVLPLHTDVVQLTRQITAMNDHDLDAAEGRIRGLESRFHRRVVVISACALALGLALGVLSIRRVQRLARQAAARLTEVQELSARLVTAQEEERRSLARELHDQVGQQLSAMLVEFGRAESAATDPARRERLTEARRLAEASVGMVRNLALMLRPSMLDDLGLAAALHWQARETARRSGLSVRMQADDIAEDLPDAQRTCVYRVVQEALSNCARHSRAGEVRVTVSQAEDWLSVSITDDGAGFEPARDKGIGILGMEERVLRLGGSFSIVSQPGAGAMLTARLPVRGSRVGGQA